MRQAVILAGGLGTRLGALTKDMPKPLMDVAGHPFLDHLLWNLERFGIEDIVLATGYLSERVEEYMAQRPAGGARIRIVVESEPLGTGGAVRNCLELLDDAFFVLNGDTLFDVNYFALIELHAASGASLAMALRRVPDVGRYGSVVLDGQRVAAFAEKGRAGEGLINGGIYYMTRDVIAGLSEGRKTSLENDVLPPLVSDGHVTAVELDGYFIDIGLPETLEQADRDLAGWRVRPIAFLDRDGVLNEDCGYLHRAEDCIFIDGAAAAIRRLNEGGYFVVVVTNQAGIARGYYDEAAFARFMDWYRDRLACEGAHIDDIFYSPYHPTEGRGDYLKDSDCRKPEPGMLLAALAKWPHRREGSFLIGDKDSDIEAARRAGLPGHTFGGGNLDAFVAPLVASGRVSSPTIPNRSCQ